MKWTWFDIAFPWIGLAVAVLLLILLFFTNVLRAKPISSRWHDRVWLSWLAMVVYLIHNVEEYGIDLFGRLHEFPNSMCATLKLPAYPGCPMPPAFFLAVNIPLFWIGAPLVALLSRRHPLQALTFYGVVFTNAVVHIVPSLAGQGYGPGTLTAVALFLPISFWVAYACFGKSGLSYKALTILVINGIILHIILMGSMALFVNEVISAPVLIIVQVLNAAIFILIPWLAEKWLGKSLTSTI